LSESKYGIWLDAHESQGFALQEAIACNVPLLVWNVTSMNQEHGYSYDDIPATSIPYWDERCGEFFYHENELESKFKTLISKLEQYRPREFIVENLSIEKCEDKLLELIKQVD
jgi:glycosyltransferase involved in cell wall biosynthesis